MEHPGTVIIRTNQEMEIFRLFLDSFWSTLLERTRVVFIDDGSPYSVRDLVLQSRPARLENCPLSFKRNRASRGTGACVNQALEFVEGDVLFVVDTDLILLDDWQTHLLSLLAGDPSVGAVGAGLLYPQTGGVQHSGIAFTEDIGRHLFLNARPEWLGDEPIEVQVVVFALCAMSRRAVEAVGPLDEGYFNSYEDFDYCLRLREAGYSVLVHPRARAYHWEMSNGIHRHTNRKRNLGRFWRLWGNSVEPDLWRFAEDRLRAALAATAPDREHVFALVDVCEQRPDSERYRSVVEALPAVRLSDVRDISHHAAYREQIWLPQALGVDGHRWPERLLFIVDNFVRLVGNRYWIELRRAVRDDDLIADLYGNVVELRDLYESAWPGTKIR